jgi:preprotein translocase subunit SecE
VTPIVQELFRFDLYKRSQGRIARQVTFAALAVIVALGAWSLNLHNSSADATWKFAVPLALFVFGIWASFRIVHIPKFADFLISVEAEMIKVSWPTRTELYRASAVVMIVIFLLAAILFLYDYLLIIFLDNLKRFVNLIFG